MGAIIVNLFRVLILVSATANAIQSRQGQESCGDKSRFISLNRTLAPLELISASGDRSIYRATNVYNFGFNGVSSSFSTWCTVDFDSDHPYIDMGFTSPVLITEIICSGTTRLNFQSTSSTTTTRRSVYYYVTNFTIEFSPSDENTNLTYYTNRDGNNIQYFTVPWLNAQISLDTPLLTKRIRIRPIDWLDTDTSITSFEYVCLGVGLYGCLASEVDTGTETTTVDEQEATSTQSSFTDSGPTPAAQLIVRDYQALAIVLPLALLTIAINAIVVVAGVYFCVVTKGQKKNSKTDGYVGEQNGQTHMTRSLEMSTRSLELSQSGEHFGGNSEGQGTSIHVVKNIIYGSSPVPSADMDNTSRGELIFTSANESGYEPVDHDGIDARDENDEDDELEFNMSYGHVDFGPPDLQPVRDHSTGFEIRGNESYNSVSTTPIFDDVEYSYPATHFAPVKIE